MENFAELNQALDAVADIIMLDNFSGEDTKRAIALVSGRAKIEISENVSAASIAALVEIAPDYVLSAGANGVCKRRGFVDAVTLRRRSQLNTSIDSTFRVKPNLQSKLRLCRLLLQINVTSQG